MGRVHGVKDGMDEMNRILAAMDRSGGLRLNCANG